MLRNWGWFHCSFLGQYLDGSFAKNTRASVQDMLQADELENQFHLPLSQDAFEELEALQQQLTALQPHSQMMTSGTICGEMDPTPPSGSIN